MTHSRRSIQASVPSPVPLALPILGELKELQTLTPGSASRVQACLTWCLCSDRGTTGKNCTHVTWFLLLGLTEQAGLKGILFAPFLFIYSVTFTGNLAMIIPTHADPCTSCCVSSPS